MFANNVLYELHVKHGQALALSDLKYFATVHVEMISTETREIVWYSKQYDARVYQGARLNGVKLHARRVMKEWTDYLMRTGERWEDKQAKEKAQRKRERRIEQLRTLIPKLQDELITLTRELVEVGRASNHTDAPLSDCAKRESTMDSIPVQREGANSQ